MGLDGYLGNFARRVVEDALTQATRSYWTKRAEAFENAMHAPGDFLGLCSVEQIEAANARCAAKAIACRRHAILCAFLGFDELYEAIVAERDAELGAAA